MTTKISSLYDAFVTLIEAAATSVPLTRIPNPYQLDKAAGMTLNNGYGLVIGPTANPRQDITPVLRFDREVSLVLTRLITTTDSNAEARGSVEKALFEDAYVLLKACEANATLNGIVIDISFNGDSGLELLSTPLQVGSYLVLTSSYRVRYSESLT